MPPTKAQRPKAKAPGRSRSARRGDSQPDNPTTLELAQLAATLARSTDPTASAKRLVTRAQEIWEAAEAARQSAAKEALIFATLAKMRDDEGLLRQERTAWDQGKGPSFIPEGLWNGLLFSYEGDKQALISRLCRTFVPTEQILEEVFPNARIPRQSQLAKLVMEVERRRIMPVMLSYVEALCRQLHVDLRQAQADASHREPAMPLRDRDGLPPLKHYMHEVNLLSQLRALPHEEPAEVKDGWLNGDYRTAWFCRWVIVARQRQLSEKAAERGGKRNRGEKK